VCSRLPAFEHISVNLQVAARRRHANITYQIPCVLSVLLSCWSLKSGHRICLQFLYSGKSLQCGPQRSRPQTGLLSFGVGIIIHESDGACS